MYVTIVLLFVAMLSGCAAIKQHSGSDITPGPAYSIAQPWESKTLRNLNPAQVMGVTVVGVSISPQSKWVSEEVYCLGNGVLPVETWRTLIFLDSNIFQGSAIINDDKTLIILLFPFEFDSNILEGKKAIIISAFAKSVMTMQGRVVATSQDDLGRLLVDVGFREQFFAQNPSAIHQAVQIPYDTPEGRIFFEGMEGERGLVERFPDVARLENGEAFAVQKDEFLSLAQASPQEHFLDRFLTEGSLPLGPGIVACPGCALPSFLWGVYRATRDPHQVCLDWIAKQRSGGKK